MTCIGQIHVGEIVCMYVILNLVDVVTCWIKNVCNGFVWIINFAILLFV